MKFDIIKDEKKAQAIRHTLGENWMENRPPGDVVSWAVAALDMPFPALRSVALDFEWGYRQQFRGASYYIQTKHGHVREIVPAAEHFLSGCLALAEQRYAMQLSVIRIARALAEVGELYRVGRKVRETTGQSHFRVGPQLYTVGADFDHFLFTARSLLDSVTTLLPFLYGPNANRFASFGGFVSKVSRETATDKDFRDDEMKQYLADRGNWFRLLRDLRDYATHAGRQRLMLLSDSDGSLKVYAHHRYEIVATMRTIGDGVDEFLRFCDDHFSRLIKGKLEEQSQAGP